MFSVSLWTNILEYSTYVMLHVIHTYLCTNILAYTISCDHCSKWHWLKKLIRVMMRNKNKLSYCSTYNVSSLAYWVDGEDRGRVWGEEETLWGTRGTVEQFKRWLYKNWTQLYSRDCWTTTIVQTTEGITILLTSLYSVYHTHCVRLKLRRNRSSWRRLRRD